MKKIILLSILVFIAAANNISGAVSNDPAEFSQQRRHVENTRHRGYTKDNFTVFYRGHEVRGASANSFIDLGEGYGKDNWTVFYEGRKVEGASANSFQNLGGGYGKDNWTVFYRGRKVEDASANSFQNLGKGYGKDNWSVFYEGRKMNGVFPSSFQVPNGPKNTHGRPSRYR